MRIVLTVPYMTKPAGAVLNSVPVARAKRMIARGIAIPFEEQKGRDNVASHKKSKRGTTQSNRDKTASKG